MYTGACGSSRWADFPALAKASASVDALAPATASAFARTSSAGPRVGPRDLASARLVQARRPSRGFQRLAKGALVGSKDEARRRGAALENGERTRGQRQIAPEAILKKAVQEKREGEEDDDR